MISHSALKITWLKPDIEEERREFFDQRAKQEWYGRHSVVWERIVSRFDDGCFTAYPRGAVLGELPVRLSYHTYDDYRTYLAKAKRGYRSNYSRMENDLQSGGELRIKAPIVLSSSGEGLLFSGYRRLCLAWNYGMIPYVWVVTI